MLFKNNNPALKNIKCESADDFLKRGGEIQTTFFKECKGRKDMSQSKTGNTELEQAEVSKTTTYNNNADDYKQRKLLGW